MNTHPNNSQQIVWDGKNRRSDAERKQGCTSFSIPISKAFHE